ncbi:MAG: hypothetical protein MUF31_13150 [Akkermansiaceae bacterium]|jgi:hypothetical protein|nr:hypothetical protein [Akkermansiaceae bacterium]
MKAPLPFLLLGILSPLLPGQSIDSLQPTPPAAAEESSGTGDDPAQTKPDNKAPVEIDPELITKPSRYVGIDIDAYVRTLSASFDIRRREIDPFARNQDPNAKPVEIARPTRIVRTAAPKEIPFSKIISNIKITALIPAKGQFMSAGQTFSVGDRILLNVGKPEKLPVFVVDVRSTGVSFRNGVNNEIAELRIELLPGGMSRGTAIRPAGLVPEDEEPTLDVTPDLDTAPSDEPAPYDGGISSSR